MWFPDLPILQGKYHFLGILFPVAWTFKANHLGYRARYEILLSMRSSQEKTPWWLGSSRRKLGSSRRKLTGSDPLFDFELYGLFTDRGSGKLSYRKTGSGNKLFWKGISRGPADPVQIAASDPDYRKIADPAAPEPRPVAPRQGGGDSRSCRP
jgi:hypothetical protein